MNSWFKSPIITQPSLSPHSSSPQCRFTEALNHIHLKPKNNYHILTVVYEWIALLEKNPDLSVDNIASHLELTKGRINQLLRLATLEPTIQQFLLKLKKPKEIRFFGEGKLRKLVSLCHTDQLEEFSQVRILLQSRGI